VSESSPNQALFDKILEGKAPLPLRSAAARGALPLPRVLLTRLHLHLMEDPEPEVRKEAEASLEAMGEEELRDIFADPECAPEVLSHFAGKASREEALAELLVFHKSVPDAALSVVAAQGNASIIELVLTNQERLLACPGLLDQLTVNPALRPDQRGRILDLLDRFIKGAATEAPAQAAAENEEIEVKDLQEAVRMLNVDVGELFASSEILDGEEFEEAEDPEIRSAYQRILILNTAQKALVAMRGGREERLILIRDTNKVVSLSVLRNPRVNEPEIENIARMRNVSDEILRTVGTNREWVKNYSVVLSLVRNPKTPPGISTNFISRLQNKDLKMLARDKSVPDVIRRMSKKTFDVRTQKSKTSFKKK